MVVRRNAQIPEDQRVERALLELADAIIRELRIAHSEPRPVTLQSRLEEDLGFDSLARVDLIARIEREFSVRLPASVLANAERLKDLAQAVVVARRLPGKEVTVHEHAPKRPASASQYGGTIATLTEVLRWHAERHPQFVHITLLDDTGTERRTTYGQLWYEALAVAEGLKAYGVGPAENVALMLPTSPEYFSCFMGILCAGATPVPLYPPTHMSQVEEHIRRHTGILENCQARTLLVAEAIEPLASLLRAHAPLLKHVLPASRLPRNTPAAKPTPRHPEDMALIQYTSGSTGNPKGVALSHSNILANIDALGSALEVCRDDVFVSWLPLYHDMGLIGAWLGTLYFGLPLVIMSPLSFLNRPIRWLQALHRYRGTLTASPNFGYELCLKNIADEDLEGIDLSSVRAAMNGAEAVMPGTIERFQNRFRPCGFKAAAMLPVYGLAECSVGLCVPTLNRPPRIDTIERDQFMRSGTAIPAAPDAPGALQFVACGHALPNHEVRIVDQGGNVLNERQAGRLEFRGPSATSGYLRNENATDQLIHNGWHDSGDRAYVADGEIFITGRIKDIVIRAGQHIYPDELEAAIAEIPGIRRGCVAVFGSFRSESGTEKLIVVAETRTSPSQHDELRRAINDVIVRLIGEPPDDVALVEPHTVLKTSSGKLRRAATRARYEQRSLRPETMSRSGALRLALGTLRASISALARRLVALLYGAYFWLISLILVIPVGLIACAPVAPATLWKAGHHAARALLRLCGIQLTIEGSGHLAGNERRVVVANHCSYLDGLVLMAAIAAPSHFVAKRELARQPILGPFLRRLGTLFVDRLNAPRANEEVQRLGCAARNGSLIIFPEGTFVATPGLRAFHLGAFLAAVDSGVPIVPIALRGTRELLPDAQWCPQRGAVHVSIAGPLRAKHPADRFAAAAELRERARKQIAAGCGEIDLAT